MNDAASSAGSAAQSGPAYAPPAAPAPMLESEARTWAMLSHLLAVLGSLISGGTMAIVAPIVIYALYKDRSALVGHHAKQELNLQLTVLVTGLASVVLGSMMFGVGLFLTIPVWSLYALYAFIIAIVAGLKANNGEYYRIPFAIPFVH